MFCQFKQPEVMNGKNSIEWTNNSFLYILLLLNFQFWFILWCIYQVRHHSNSKLDFILKPHGGVVVIVFTSSAIDREFEPWSDQTKDYKIGICCFSAKHATLKRKNKDWLARNQDNVSEWGDMSIRGLLFQWDSTIKIHLSVLV